MADPGFKFGRGTWRAPECKPVTVVWGPAGFRGRAPAGGRKANSPESESLSAFRRPVEVAELPRSALTVFITRSLIAH